MQSRTKGDLSDTSTQPMNIYLDDFDHHNRYFRNIQHDGTEHRFYFSTEKRTVSPLGFAVWNEQISVDARLEANTKFVLTMGDAEQLALRRCEQFSRKLPPCTYHQVLIDRAEFAVSVMKEQYRTLRRWVSARGLAQSDFVIGSNPRYYRLSFRSMNMKVEDAVLYLKMAGVLLQYCGGAYTIEIDGHLEDLRTYKA